MRWVEAGNPPKTANLPRNVVRLVLQKRGLQGSDTRAIASMKPAIPGIMPLP